MKPGQRAWNPPLYLSMLTAALYSGMDEGSTLPGCQVLCHIPNSHSHGPSTVQGARGGRWGWEHERTSEQKGVPWSRADNPQRDGCHFSDGHVMIITHAMHGLQTLKRDNQSGFILLQLSRANYLKCILIPDRKDTGGCPESH